MVGSQIKRMETHAARHLPAKPAIRPAAICDLEAVCGRGHPNVRPLSGSIIFHALALQMRLRTGHA